MQPGWTGGSLSKSAARHRLVRIVALLGCSAAGAAAAAGGSPLADPQPAPETRPPAGGGLGLQAAVGGVASRGEGRAGQELIYLFALQYGHRQSWGGRLALQIAGREGGATGLVLDLVRRFRSAADAGTAAYLGAGFGFGFQYCCWGGDPGILFGGPGYSTRLLMELTAGGHVRVGGPVHLDVAVAYQNVGRTTHSLSGIAGLAFLF